jgi:hypothetical protein
MDPPNATLTGHGDGGLDQASADPAAAMVGMNDRVQREGVDATVAGESYDPIRRRSA